MSKGKTALLYILLTVFSVAFIFVGNRITSDGAMMFTGQIGSYTDIYIVRVDAVLETNEREYNFGGGQMVTETKIKFSGSVLFGEDKGKTLIAQQSYDDITSAVPTPVRAGDWIFVYLDANISSEYFAGNLFRIRGVIVLALIFFVLLIIFGRFKGVTTILALGFSVMSIFLVFIPAILSGHNIYFWAILICLFTITVMPFYVGGFNKKSIASALGCIGGVAIAGILTFVMNMISRITGAVNDETMYVAFIFPDNPIDLRAITFAAILIGALGATVDVSMSIATSLNEMNENCEESSFSSLWKNGMNIGRDIMGAQTSTLVLAYIGGALSVTLLLVAYQNSIIEMLNLELVIIELLQIIIGGFTILFVIPATALVCALMFEKQGAHKRKKDQVYRIGH